MSQQSLNKKALIAMSGGVDSSVSALLMQQQGYECIGATMSLFQKSTCGGEQDVRDAAKICQDLGMEHHVINFADKFREHVISRFIDAYEHGRTPNPCVDCNRHLKFGKLYAKAQELGCEFVVTGHYAQVRYDEAKGRYLLVKGVDPHKDQSYVLYSLTQEQLAHVQFPLGGYCKPEIRDIAEKHGFVNARKHDSQDICFVENGKYAEFIEKQTGKKFKAGDFVDVEGKVLGRHKGIIYYTVGQRKGLGLALPQPMYVKEIDVAHNKVILATNDQLFSTHVEAKDINLIDCERITEPRRLKARIRYHHVEQWATVTQPDEDTLLVDFDEPQRAITKGQSLVLYDGDVVVGGGTII
ncbi:MAG: tRNA 2-thiouridine(34) synthase MnmA [Phascolarctobacterium sp.]|nr:tRNA 2-thiouridine(34) synthase MnmA [Phascolarctobacterium sp.]